MPFYYVMYVCMPPSPFDSLPFVAIVEIDNISCLCPDSIDWIASLDLSTNEGIKGAMTKCVR